MSWTVQPLPECAPRTGNAFTRWFGRSVLRMGGWKISGSFPNQRKLVIIVAPHSTWWDGVWGLAAKLALGVRVLVIGKRELFHGPLGWLLRRFGAIPVDRARAHGVVEMVVRSFAQTDTLWFVVAPEGTRKPVPRWKTGFWHIARAADVPVQCVYFHYPERTIGIGPLLAMSADEHADVARLREFYQPWMGKYHGTD
ncbi:MAG: lysophospholipid acyltransferase family protein [Proteobacteria bacterium]|nr:lysophospholipid acyltransferase family protein [Pseudomonadota bacterium]